MNNLNTASESPKNIPVDIETIIEELTNSSISSISTAHELTFLTQHTDLNETTIMANALQIGLKLLYHQIGEQLFIEGRISPQDAVTILGEDRVKEIEYAQQSLAQDVARGLTSAG